MAVAGVIAMPRVSGSRKGTMRKPLLTGLVGVVVMSTSANAQSVKIEHQPAACAVSEKFPRFEARFLPPESVAVARIFFQGENRAEWFAVVMKPEGASFAGVLPKPKKSLKAFRYYIEVTDKALVTSRSTEYTTQVVSSSGECSGKAVAGTLGSASVLLQGPAGAAALPAGFASTGVTAAGSASGSAAGSSTGAAGVAGAAGAAAAAGGGLSGGAVVGIVAGAGAAAAGVAVAAGKGSESGPAPGTGGSPSPTPPTATSYTGPFSGQRTDQFVHAAGPGGCQTVTRALSGTIRITLNQAQGGTANGTANISGTMTVIANTGTCSADQGVGFVSFIGHSATVTGTVGNIAFSVANQSESVTFTGALNGGVITGTATFTQNLTTPTSTRNGTTSIPVTLR